jgi:hypothetical protein
VRLPRPNPGEITPSNDVNIRHALHPLLRRVASRVAASISAWSCAIPRQWAMEWVIV